MKPFINGSSAGIRALFAHSNEGLSQITCFVFSRSSKRKHYEKFSGNTAKIATVLTNQMTADLNSSASKGCVLIRWASAGRSHPEATELSLLTCDLQHSVTIVTVHT
ncbi:hypothetical protein E2C01_040773 [Portunus trituberculatus]|uniref:Uncharacterized protein n=1 Tax=Portunus trituberculatus TaxID=210409 RepID=A0A5B7FP41_PORTR|nr:hypothetical protein [Portunus trituberculatus]